MVPSSTYGSSESACDALVEVEAAVNADAIDFLFREGSANGMLMRTETRTFSSGGSGVSGGFSASRERRVSGRSAVGELETTVDSDGGGTGDWAWSRLPIDMRNPGSDESEKRDSLRDGVDAGGGVGEESGVAAAAGLCESSGAFSHLHATGYTTKHLEHRRRGFHPMTLRNITRTMILSQSKASPSSSRSGSFSFTNFCFSGEAALSPLWSRAFCSCSRSSPSSPINISYIFGFSPSAPGFFGGTYVPFAIASAMRACCRLRRAYERATIVMETSRSRTMVAATMTISAVRVKEDRPDFEECVGEGEGVDVDADEDVDADGKGAMRGH